MAIETLSNKKSSQSANYLRHTKIPTILFESPKEVDRYVSQAVEDLIRKNNSAGKLTVLGLPTGSTPIGVYRELIRLHKEENLDFSNVITFNLDEYWPMDPDSIHSYNLWMRDTFFDHVNIPAKNIHIPQGNLDHDDIDVFCDEYEQEIEKVGGVQLQLLGIGRTGHIAFNEPGSSRNSLTRIVSLDPVTRKDAADSFYGEDNVPHRAITMGVSSILSAHNIIIMALGEHKASIVKKTCEDRVSEEITASFLQTHPHATFAIDQGAGSELTAVKTPWLVGPVVWNKILRKRAIIWLSQKVNKPLLKLEKGDFAEYQLHDLIKDGTTANNVCQGVFEEMLAGVCNYPAGKVEDKKNTVIVFSPHPDDDVISMGGTLITMADQGHDVQIAYMTSGNIAVFDHDALRHIDYVDEFLSAFNLNDDESQSIIAKMKDNLSNRKPGDPDTSELLEVKGLIRKTEATTGAIAAGVHAEKLHFLNLPFYKTGNVSKRPVGNDDIEIIANLLRKQKPDQIYVAGDLSDPHGTHRMCADAIIGALKVLEKENFETEVWLYRGAWEEYEPHEIERAVPLSPEMTVRKKFAIFKHESQKDQALYPGSDDREFWVRAEERTKNTARIYNDLGLPEYHALEGFILYRGQL